MIDYFGISISLVGGLPNYIFINRTDTKTFKKFKISLCHVVIII